jgi:hypothetical protein
MSSIVQLAWPYSWRATGVFLAFPVFAVVTMLMTGVLPMYFVPGQYRILLAWGLVEYGILLAPFVLDSLFRLSAVDLGGLCVLASVQSASILLVAAFTWTWTRAEVYANFLVLEFALDMAVIALVYGACLRDRLCAHKAHATSVLRGPEPVLPY